MGVVYVGMMQSSSKKVITKEEWEKKLSEVKIRKEDMNRLVMNFLVTEGYVEAAEKFQHESGTQRILCSCCIYYITFFTITMSFQGALWLWLCLLLAFSDSRIISRFLEGRYYLLVRWILLGQLMCRR